MNEEKRNKQSFAISMQTLEEAKKNRFLSFRNLQFYNLRFLSSKMLITYLLFRNTKVNIFWQLNVNPSKILKAKQNEKRIYNRCEKRLPFVILF